MQPRHHQIDGVFDDNWGPECKIRYVQGKFTQARFDWVPDEASPSRGWLYLLNAWLVDDSGTVHDDCFNRFTVTIEPLNAVAEQWSSKFTATKLCAQQRTASWRRAEMGASRSVSKAPLVSVLLLAKTLITPFVSFGFRRRLGMSEWS